MAEGIIIGGSGNALLFGHTDGVEGKWDRSTSMPTATQAIRYNGILRATRVYAVYYSDDADLAESYKIKGEFKVGDLIAIEDNGDLVRNDIYGNTKVLGFVSEEPGMVLGGDKDIPIALSGRVRVNCENIVHPGDFLIGCGEGKVIGVSDIERTKRGQVVGIALEANVDDKVLAFVTRM